MRRPLDEAVQGWVEPRLTMVANEENGGGEDEIEYDAQELRRLRPY